MKQIEGWELVTEAGDIKTLPAGAYVCKIVEAIDVPDKEYLDVYFDIVEGEFAGYFKVLQENTGKNRGRCTRSYKTNALPFFKSFTTAIEKSNPGYKWAFDEKTLTDKVVVVVFRDEEYKTEEGEVRTIAKPDEFRSLEALKEGKITIKPCKKLPAEEVPAAPVSVADEDLPF